MPQLPSVLLLFLLPLFSPWLHAGPVYHWTDAQGHPVYSDQPRVQGGPAKRSVPSGPASYRGYLTSLQTDDPKQRIIRLHLSPQLAPGDRVELRLNGRRYQSALHSERFLLHQLPSGRHRLQARIYRQQQVLPSRLRSLRLQIP